MGRLDSGSSKYTVSTPQAMVSMVNNFKSWMRRCRKELGRWVVFQADFSSEAWRSALLGEVALEDP